MSKNINESISFLLAEFNRLKVKQKNKTITKEELETLQKISSFIGKK